MKNTISEANNILYVTSSFLQNRYKSSDFAYAVGASDVDISDYDDTILLKRIKKVKSINRKSDTIQIGVIGNFKTKYKGIHIAIEALGKLKQEHNFNNFSLRILGKGNPKDYEKLISKYHINQNVFFDGTLPNGQPVFNWLDNLDLYLHPSLTEGLPESVIEAMSRASIIIGSKTGGIPELLDHEYIVKPGDVKKLQIKIRKVLNLNEDELISVAQRNFSEAKKYQSKRLKKIRYDFYEHLKNQTINESV